MIRYLVMYGDPASGFYFAGPFETSEAAAGWAETDVVQGASWWVMPLQDPAEEELRRMRFEENGP